MKRPVHYAQQPMDISCLIAEPHEKSKTFRGGPYGMQNATELRHSRLIVATHGTSNALSKATLRLQNKRDFADQV